MPFNFCNRSVMLFAVTRGHQDYTDGGDEGVLHLVSSVRTAVALQRPWAFTDRHAELGHALHFDDLRDLGEVAWKVMDRRYWSEVKEERQAEFLVHDFFPWTAVEEIGVKTSSIQAIVQQVLEQAPRRPPIGRR